jgi:hypothetical protein
MSQSALPWQYMSSLLIQCQIVGDVTIHLDSVQICEGNGLDELSIIVQNSMTIR